ncbi:MAG: hypothetical protein DWQ36_09765 [Acidobacteria bacterium]|nr:MAG: hypothetical protein DWQ30_01045 [Acidobacteriota bacterium]REK08347.1 MAG: hypothetical protein DWQ36_09765 [Acidobacteriota bacterium]
MSQEWNLEALRESVRSTERRYRRELEADLEVGWIDMHSHVLPGVDDGAESFDHAVELLHEAWEGGTREVYVTPHMFRNPFDNFDAAEMVDAFGRFAEGLRELAVHHVTEYRFLRDLKIHLGAENYVSPEFLTALAERRVLTLGSTRCLLLELPDGLVTKAAESAVRKVVDAGYVPVLAHVERVTAFTRSAASLERLLEEGAIGQVNLPGLIDPRTFEVAAGHVQSGRARLVASDGHDLAQRTMRLDRLDEIPGPRRLRTLVEEAMTVQPRRIFELHRAG